MLSRLTELSSCHVGENAETLGLWVDGTPAPLGCISVLVLGLQHGLIHWGGTVYKRLSNREATATTESVAPCQGHRSFR